MELTTAEVAQRAGVAPVTVRYWTWKLGALRPQKVAGIHLYDAREVTEFLKRPRTRGRKQKKTALSHAT